MIFQENRLKSILPGPEQGSEVEWLATVNVLWIEGQGIAWDRSVAGREMWGILRRNRQVFRFEVPEIEEVAEVHPGEPLRGPGEFLGD